MFVFGSLKDFSASCSWAASSSNSFSHPSAVYFRTLLPFVISVLSVVSPPPCCRQAALCFSYVVCWIWIETLKKTYITCIYVILFLCWNGLFSSFTCFSCCHRWLFPSTGWCFLLVLRIVFWCLRRDRDSFNMLWCWFITFCVAFYSCLHLRGIRGRQPDRQGGVRLRRIDAVWNVA